MRVVVQRVSRAKVTVEDAVVGEIGRGFLVLLGIHLHDDETAIRFLTEKVVHLRIFPDDQDKMNRSLLDIAGQALVVSQFTLYGDCRKGRRPSFVDAAPPALAIPLYEEFVAGLRHWGVDVATGQFGAAMEVELVNAGPVTLILDSPANHRGIESPEQDVIL